MGAKDRDVLSICNISDVELADCGKQVPYSVFECRVDARIRFYPRKALQMYVGDSLQKCMLMSRLSPR